MRNGLKPYGALRHFVQLLLLLFCFNTVPALAAEKLVLAFGDSLTAGYNLPPGQGFAPQLQAALRREGIAATVANAGVSGDTTAGGRARLGWTLSGLPRQPDLAIVELGANDMLRSVDPAETEKNLDAILAELKARHIPVLLAGMLAARNLDPAYRARFEAIFPRLARKYGAKLYPFFMDGVAQDRSLRQADGLHPTAAGVRVIVTRIGPAVRASLGR